ncbi:MAG TPA: tRNA (adenosine(37)-N6)-threonylcarbamoyltransferase complex ATPase subunit type 1 TsaE [Acidimicrobiia bacterium]|jgi:tRNA threonylcarbamoyladenosine biosynthesis protein TsaE|nr:tRNA (adenosine(37)-N6)-threonylcarbamoyltransferase complex ATPase subunit type 1 TsaE [Acidimicrobiia bacterium]
MISFVCPGPGDTANLAARLAPLLRPGDIIILCGQLGSGKTLFTGGLAAGLGVEEPVTSPSFVLVREYRSGFLPLIHADIYRLTSRNEFDDLDLIPQALEGVLVIEWGDAIEQMLPNDHLRIDIDVDEDDGSRRISLHPSGAWASRLPGEMAS